MNTINKRPSLAAIFFFAIILFASCSKPEEEIGLNLIPEDELLDVNRLDTFSIKAYTVAEEALVSSATSRGLIGAYNDPVFGMVQAGHATRIGLSSASPDFLDGATMDEVLVDSIILYLRYPYNPTLGENVFKYRELEDGIYGKNGSQYFEVFELDELLKPDSLHKTNRPIQHLSSDLVKEGANLISPTRQDTTFVSNQALITQVKIPLKNELATRFIQLSDDPLDPEVDILGFLEEFKGIYITVDPGQSNINETGIIYFNTNDVSSAITMYYRTLNDGVVVDTSNYSFPMLIGGGNKYNLFEHDYTVPSTDPELVSQLSGDISSGQQSLYIQSMAGTKTWVELSNILALRDSIDFSINRAELVLPVRQDFEEFYLPPYNLVVYGLNEEDRAFILPDQLENITNYYNGIYNPETGEYRVNISRYLQQLLNGEYDHNRLEVVTSSANQSANRVILNGPEYDPLDNSKNLRLEITYTKF